MGKAVCFANGMLPREDTNWKPAIIGKRRNSDFSGQTTLINEFLL